MRTSPPGTTVSGSRHGVPRPSQARSRVVATLMRQLPERQVATVETQLEGTSQRRPSAICLHSEHPAVKAIGYEWDRRRTTFLWRCSRNVGGSPPPTGYVRSELGVDRRTKTADTRGQPPIGQLEDKPLTSSSLRTFSEAHVRGSGILTATVFQPRYIGILGFWCGTAVASHTSRQIRLVERMILRCPGPAPAFLFAA